MVYKTTRITFLLKSKYSKKSEKTDFFIFEALVCNITECYRHTLEAKIFTFKTESEK
jgi:hypothetical protein